MSFLDSILGGTVTNDNAFSDFSNPPTYAPSAPENIDFSTLFLGNTSTPVVSPTPVSTSSPDPFASFLQTIGANVPGVLNTAITSIANNIFKNPTLNTSNQNPQTTANASASFLGKYTPWILLGGGAIVVFLLLRK